MNLRPPIGRSGRAVIAGADGVLINEHLARPAATTILRVSELPYLVPILEQSFDHPDYVLVVVDHSGADITTHIGGTLRSETVDGTGYPVHKAAGAETAGYGDPQLRTEEAARKNVRAVADRVAELADDKAIDVIFVVGEVRSRSDLLAALPERLHDRAVTLEVGARHSGHDFTGDRAGHRGRVRQTSAAHHRRCRTAVYRRDRAAIGAGGPGARRSLLGAAPGRGGNADHR